MAAPARSRLALAFLMLLSLGVAVGLPAEDVLDAVYDESEPVPYEVAPLLSVAGTPEAAQTTEASPSSLHPKLGFPSPVPPAPVRDTDTNRSANAPILLALLCTLLC